MDPKYFLVIAVVVVMGWFAFGIIYNLRRGEALLRWMQAGLPRIGERTTMRWLGSSVAELVIAKAKGPIRRLETLVVLSPRDVPWLWLLALRQGRQDTLIFRAHLNKPPHLDFDLIDTSSWTGRMALKKAAELGWESRPYQDMQLLAPQIWHERAADMLDRVEIPAGRLARRYRRLSLRRAIPHLEVHLAFPDPNQVDARQFFDALRDLANAINERD